MREEKRWITDFSHNLWWLGFQVSHIIWQPWLTHISSTLHRALHTTRSLYCVTFSNKLIIPVFVRNTGQSQGQSLLPFCECSKSDNYMKCIPLNGRDIWCNRNKAMHIKTVCIVRYLQTRKACFHKNDILAICNIQYIPRKYMRFAPFCVLLWLGNDPLTLPVTEWLRYLITRGRALQEGVINVIIIIIIIIINVIIIVIIIIIMI